MYIYSVDSKRIEHVFAEQFCQDFVPNPQQRAVSGETFPRGSDFSMDFFNLTIARSLPAIQGGFQDVQRD